jgi:serine-type D-Ala-D-Ala carboxypeptidase/endopeptidase
MWLTLGIIFSLLLFGFLFLMTLGILSERAYQSMVDTHDLQDRLRRVAELHLTGKPQGQLVIGVYQKGKRFTKSYGAALQPVIRIPDDRLLYEIGSITKLFTGIALAQQVRLGVVKLTDTLEQHLDSNGTIPAELQPITLLQLATHSSGLPRLPINLEEKVKNESDPYAHFTADDLMEGLSQTELDSKPGTASEYSNLGMGLLGHLLSERTMMTYGLLIDQGICQPLGMKDTTLTPSEEQQQRLVPGHDEKGEPASNWHFQALAPTGGLRSTAHDMLNFIEAHVKGTSEPLATDLKMAIDKHYSNWSGDMGLAWHLMNVHNNLTIHWHNGGTGGYSSYLALSPDHQTGVILMINCSEATSGKLDQLGLQAIKWASKISLS